jgi:hypothetical protein
VCGMEELKMKNKTRMELYIFASTRLRNLPGGNGVSALYLMSGVEDFCEQASTACYGNSFTLWRRSVLPVRYELDCKYCYKWPVSRS